MQTFKPMNLIKSNDIVFKEWKIKKYSKLSVGTILFIYEYHSDGVSKQEKYKSHLNGITVLELNDIKTGDLITTETNLFSYEKCSHPVKSKDMCAICGEDLRKREENSFKLVKKTNGSSSASVKMVHVDPSLQISEEMALEIGKKDLINLVKNRKLVLLVDLDHTLIHTTNEYVDPNLKEVYHYELVQKNVWYHTKFRPGCNKFLQEMSKLYELHMVTFGERNYAHKIADLMDPGRIYFHDRILSRNEIFNPVSKSDNLRALFPRGDLMVCIIDDREDVWNYARNLICVQPYVYFKNTGDINDPHMINNKSRKRKLNENNNNNINQPTTSSKISNEEENSNSSDSSENFREEKTTENLDVDTDDYLVYLEEILRKIHDEYYKIYESRLKSHQKPINEDLDVDESDLPDVKKVLPLIKSRILENCVITFSGVVPTGYDLKKQRCYLMATSLGAKVSENLVLAEEELDLENVEQKKSKYEYVFDDNDSSSNCSGGDNKSDCSDDVLFTLDNQSVSDSRKNKKRYTTHLVAAKYGTSKVHEALKSKIQIKVVTPEWLIDSNYKWVKCDEEKYKLTKEYDYKNCLFHHEYNIHQKYSLSSGNNTSKSSNQSKFSLIKVSSQEDKSKIIKNENENSFSSYQGKTKKLKSDEYEPELESETCSKELINEEIFELMDKEVNDELEDSNDTDVEGNFNLGETDESESDPDIKNKKSLVSTSSSSSFNSTENSIDDEFALELERDLLNKNKK